MRAGPAYRARAPSRDFRAALQTNDFEAALALLEAQKVTELERFVGDRAQRLTPLLWACKATASPPYTTLSSEMAEALVAAGADVSVRCSRGFGPLYHGWLCPSLLTALLDKGAKEPAALVKLARVSDATTGGPCPNYEPLLMRCIGGGDLAHLSAAVKEQILFICCITGYDAPAAALIAAGVKWQVASTLTLLHHAAASGCVATVTALLDKGAGVDALNDLQQTPLHAACNRGRSDVALLLLTRGAAKGLDDTYGMSPLNYAMAAKGDTAAVIAKLRA